MSGYYDTDMNKTWPLISRNLYSKVYKAFLVMFSFGQNLTILLSVSATIHNAFLSAPLKLELRLLEEISTISDMLMIPL